MFWSAIEGAGPLPPDSLFSYLGLSLPPKIVDEDVRRGRVSPAAFLVPLPSSVSHGRDSPASSVFLTPAMLPWAAGLAVLLAVAAPAAGFYVPGVACAQGLVDRGRRKSPVH